MANLVAASDIFQEAMGIFSGQAGASSVPAGRFAALRGYVNRALARMWQGEEWPTICPIEQRRYRLDWSSGTTYSASTSAAAVEVYFPPADKYYQSLVGSNLNHAPATQSGTTWTENSAYWAESKSSYSGNDWATGTVYSVGTIVRNASGSSADLRYYQCVSAHTAGASLDTSKFSILTPFDTYISLTQTGQTEISEVFNVTTAHPYLDRGFRKLKHIISVNGVQVVAGPNTVWLSFRRVPPKLKGDVFSAATAYSPGQQVYYTANGVGNFYDCVVGTSAGETPASAPNKWALVEIPEIFRGWAVWSAVGDLQDSDGQTDKARVSRATAQGFYDDECDKLYRQQQQTQPITVTGY